MKRLDYYVLKELAVPLFIGTVVFALLFVANDMIYIYKTFNVDAVPPLAIAQLLIFKFPFWLNVTLPIGTALGASLAVSRLARESEITAMRAAGIRVMRVFAPLLFAGVLVAVLDSYVVEQVVPPASKAYRKLVNEVGLLAAVPQFRSNVMLNVDRYTASFGSVARQPNGVVALNDVLMFERPRPNEAVCYKAKNGTYKDGVWKIRAANIVRWKDSSVTSIESNDVTIYEPIRIADLFVQPTPEEETSSSLLKAIRQYKASHLSTTNLEIQFHQKLAGPVACLIFAFTGAVLAMRLSKAGPFIGVMVSLGIAWLYFNAYVISGEVLGRNGWVSPIMAAWLPNIVFGAFGLLLVRRME